MATLKVCDKPHSVYGTCISPNKPAFSLLWFALELFACEAKDPHLAAYFRDLPET